MVRFSKEDILSKEEVDDLINACKSKKETFVATALVYSGMRAGELENMKETWINWQKDIIKIPKQQGKWKPKTKAAEREIPIIETSLRRVLRDWFLKQDDVGISRVSIFRIIRRVAQRIKIMRKVYPHALRATYASMLAERNISPATIQAIMGWSKLATAESYVRARRAIEEVKEKW